MTIPNIVGVTTINGITTCLSLGTTNVTTILSNANNSDRVFKINSIIAANDSGSTANITVAWNDQANGSGTSFNICRNFDVATKAVAVILDKASSIYLEENRSIVVQASASNSFDIILSYESIA